MTFGPPPAHLAGHDWRGERARDERDERRRRVLRFPNLARRLTQRPLSYSEPEQWTGYVPPADWCGQRNDSGRRDALLDILRAVVEAEKDAPEGPADEVREVDDVELPEPPPDEEDG